MTDKNRIAGILFVKIDGVQFDIIGDWTFNLGARKREAKVGMDRVHGYGEKPQFPWVEGEIRFTGELDLEALLNIREATITLELANGKTIVFREAWYAADGDVGTEESNIQARFEAKRAEVV